MSSVSQVSARDPADLLCWAFDTISRSAFRASVEQWEGDAELERISAQVEADALAGTLRKLHVDQDAAAYAVVRGLDRALAHANPLLSGVPPEALRPIAMRYARTGRLDSGAVAGGLLPRFASGGRRGQLPDDIHDALGAVVRVPALDWDACDHAVLPPWARLTRPDREDGLRIATTPLIADPDELEWRVVERRDLRFYRIRPNGGGSTQDRIERVIRGFDEAHAVIGVAPELCLSRGLLDRWRSALAERQAAAESALRLVLVGTGDVEGADPPANTAVLLDAHTGEVVARQRKVFPFNLSTDDVELWGLADRLAGPIDEDLTPGERVTVLEAGGVRLAILVCEDLARVPALAGPLCRHGISLLLVPVFARPTKDRRWERARAESYSDSTGATVVVANSLVMATLLGTPVPVGTAIAVGAGAAAVGTAQAPDATPVFALSGGAPELRTPRPQP
jgi:predicted amidohydrolase